MPAQPPKACSTPFCPNLTTSRLCAGCDKERHKDFDQRRTDDQGFYKSAAWQRVRKIVLNRDPLCVECLQHGRTTASRIADHIKPRQDYPELALNPENCRGVCKSCHERHGSRARRKRTK